MIMLHDTYEYKHLFTQEEVELFADLTGDKNPVHLNKKLAKESEFGDQVVQGMLIGAIFSKVFGTMWPADDSIYISQDIMFILPVYVGQEYRLKFSCDEIDRSRHIGTINATMKDSDGKIIVKLKAKIKSDKHFSNPKV